MESKLCKKCAEEIVGLYGYETYLKMRWIHCHHSEKHEVSGDAPDAITKLKARVKELEDAIKKHKSLVNIDGFYYGGHYIYDEQLYAVLEGK